MKTLTVPKMPATRAVAAAANTALAAALLVYALSSHPARADADKPYALDPAYRKECGDCHVAYPPALLHAGQWRQVMQQLEHHYGVDASIDSETATRLTAWLEHRAGTRKGRAGAGTPPRITEGSWFRHEHDEAPASARRAAGSLARCDACHREAARGDYSERNIQYPQTPRGGRS